MYRHHAAFAAMACDNAIEVHAPDAGRARAAAEAAVQEVLRIERKYSRYRDDSVVSAINRAAGGAPVGIDDETARLLDFADACHRQSGGLFDITSGVLRRAWDFRASAPPDDAALAALLPLVGWPRVERRGQAVRLPEPGMEIDFGGFGKEYAADRAAQVLLDAGIANATVNLGGDVVILGPQPDGQPWRIGIRHPRVAGALCATFPMSSGALATSGDYERFLLHEGIRHCHILDPRNGRSVQGFQSVTMLAPTCLVAGSLATIAMLLGEKAGLAFLAASGCEGLAIGGDGAAHRVGRAVGMAQ